jgi:Rrf2 family protein
MKIASGVEWAAHACALLAMLPKGASLSAEALANYHDVPPAYMAKQMQALRRAGLIVSQRGAVGGYRLAATPNDINLWDITEAIEGSAPRPMRRGQGKLQKTMWDCRKLLCCRASLPQRTKESSTFRPPHADRAGHKT